MLVIASDFSECEACVTDDEKSFKLEAEMAGDRFAVLGLGRSGLAIVEACVERDWPVAVYDESPATGLHKPELLADLTIPIHLDWHEQIRDYDILVVNPAIPRENARIQEALSEGKEVWGEIEFAYHISTAPIVAITGTNGKSTTTVMTFLALQACGFDAKLCGNIYGSGYGEAPLTEQAAKSTPDQILVAEISSYQLEWVNKFRPICAGISNITPDHLPRYDHSFDAYAATKMNIFSAQGEGDFAVVRANDPVVSAPNQGQQVQTFEQQVEGGITVLGELIGPDVLFFEEGINATNAAMAMALTYGTIRALAEKGDGRAELLLEKANRRQPNSLPSEIINGLQQFHGIAHRMQRLGKRADIEVINNSMCTNPDAVVQSTMGLTGRVHLLMGGVNKDLDFGPLRSFLAKHDHKVYLFGRNARDLNNMLGEKYPEFETMKQAFASSTEHARSHEIIMLAPGCASSDQFRDFVDRGNVFTAIAKEWLSNESSMEAR